MVEFCAVSLMGIRVELDYLPFNTSNFTVLLTSLQPRFLEYPVYGLSAWRTPRFNLMAMWFEIETRTTWIIFWNYISTGRGIWPELCNLEPWIWLQGCECYVAASIKNLLIPYPGFHKRYAWNAANTFLLNFGNQLDIPSSSNFVVTVVRTCRLTSRHLNPLLSRGYLTDAFNFC